MIAVPLFRDINMATVTSPENTLWTHRCLLQLHCKSRSDFIYDPYDKRRAARAARTLFRKLENSTKN